MPANKRDTRNGKESTGPGHNAEQPEPQMARRTAAFGVAIVVLGVVATWFVATTFSDQRKNENVALSAPVEHTVKILDAPVVRKKSVKSMMEHPVLRRLTDGYRIYTKEIDGDRIALCAGRFDSANAPRAQRLLKELKQYERQGERPFHSATLVRVSASR